jgi:hypothetical protein
MMGGMGPSNNRRGGIITGHRAHHRFFTSGARRRTARFPPTLKRRPRLCRHAEPEGRHQATGGKLAEAFGPRRVFLAGILTVLAGGLVGGFGQDLTTLVVASVLIGVGTSAGYPSAMLLIRRRADAAGLDAPPGSVLGGLMIAGAATAAVGLPIGGVLVDACREGSRSHRSRPGPQLRGYLFDSRSATRRIRSMSVAEGITRPEI